MVTSPAASGKQAAALAALALAAAAILWYPLRHASAYMDDYLLVALGAHLASPLPLLLQDSAGSFFFRPLVMFIWWLSDQVLGSSAPAHYAFNMVVHALNGWLLGMLLRRLGVSFVVASLASLAFLAHPTAFSAAAWLCIRFDLFAVTFGLAGLMAVERYRVRPTPAWLALAAATIAASFLSKETGFGIAVVALLALAWPGGVATSRQRVVLAAAIAALAVAAIAVRPFVLRDVPQAATLRDQAVSLVLAGIWKWARGLPGFLVPMQGNAAAVAMWLAAMTALPCALLVPAVLRNLRGLGAGLGRCAVVGAAIVLLAAIAPSPIVGQIPIPSFRLGTFDVGALLSSRFFYLPLVGFAMLGAAGGEALARAPVRPWAKRMMVAVFVLALVGLLASTRSVGRSWAAHTQKHSGAMVRAAVEAVGGLKATPGCKVYLLGIPDASLHFREMADTGVKQKLARGHPLMKCFIQAEHAPWYHLVDRTGLPPDAHRPLETIHIAGKPFPPLVLGNLAYYYLRIPSSDAVLDDPNATFFAYRDGRFVDVTADVRSRRLQPRFYDNRP